jgi:DNA polymerase-3 subunit chi
VRVDFYQLSRDPAEALIPRLAENTLNAGERLLVVSADAPQLDRVSRALWEYSPESFLAHGRAGGPHDSSQPILLSERTEAANKAGFCILADGQWRESTETAFARVFLLFDAATLDEARACWRSLAKDDAVERHFWRQEGRRWLEGP